MFTKDGRCPSVNTDAIRLHAAGSLHVCLFTNKIGDVVFVVVDVVIHFAFMSGVAVCVNM